MNGHTFYHNTIRKYVVLFGTMFNDIYVNRPDASTNVIHSLKVPISYGPKEKTLSRVSGDPSLNRPVAIVLPRMSFEMLSIAYAPTRKLITINKNKKTTSDPDVLNYQYNPVPYDFTFELNIMVRNADDGTRILEQILPFFTPDWTPTINLIPEIGLKYDIPIVLNSVDSTDTYEGDYESRRALIWTLVFTVKGYIFGPVNQQKIIKQAIVTAVHASDNLDLDSFDFMKDEEVIVSSSSANVSAVYGAEIDSTTTVYPGLLANGSPTEDPSLTIPTANIYSNSNYGYIITRE